MNFTPSGLLNPVVPFALRYATYLCRLYACLQKGVFGSMRSAIRAPLVKRSISGLPDRPQWIKQEKRTKQLHKFLILWISCFYSSNEKFVLEIVNRLVVIINIKGRNPSLRLFIKKSNMINVNGTIKSFWERGRYFMGWDAEKSIDYYYGEYKNGFFGKKSSIKLDIYPSQLEGTGFELYENELGKEVYSFEIAYGDVSKIYVGEIEKQKALFIEYNNHSVVSNRKSTVVLLGMENPQKWSDLIEETRKKFISKQEKKRQLDLQRREEEHRLEIELSKEH